MSINNNLKKQLIEARRNVKRKLELLKSGEVEKEIKLEKTYIPITKKLKEITENLQNIPNLKGKQKELEEEEENIKPVVNPYAASTSQNIAETFDSDIDDKKLAHSTYSQKVINLYLDGFNELIKPYIKNVITKSETIDFVYGVSFYETDKGEFFKMGSKEIDFKNNNIIIDNKIFPGTIGLYELIFKKLPNHRLYTDEDSTNYKEILNITNAARRDNSPTGQLKGNQSYKYKNIISVLLTPKRHSSFSLSPVSATQAAKLLHKRTGKGLELFKNYNNKPVEYEFWDNPNELVEKLKKFIASKNAGNNNLNNEIISIIEELKEANIIL